MNASSPARPAGPVASPGGYPGSEQPGGGFRGPEEQYPPSSYPPGQAYPSGQPYPATPPPADPNRGWNP